MGYSVLAASGVAARAAGSRHDRCKNINFHEWSKLDKELCDTFIQIHCYGNKIYFHDKFDKLSDKTLDGAEFFSKNMITTGSTVEYSASCRSLINEKMKLELDQMFCLGKIDKAGGSNNLMSVKNHPGYFQLKPVHGSTYFHSSKILGHSLDYVRSQKMRKMS